jgi:WD40 repeat protein
MLVLVAAGLLLVLACGGGLAFMFLASGGKADRPGSEPLAVAAAPAPGDFENVRGKVEPEHPLLEAPRQAPVPDRRKDGLVLPGHLGEITDVAFSPDGKRLATAGGDAMVRLYDPTTGKAQAVFRGHAGPGSFNLHSVSFSSDGKRILSADSLRALLWEIDSGKVLATFTRPKGEQWGFYGAYLSPDAKLVLTPLLKSVILWEVATGKENRRLQGQMRGLTFSPDGKLLAFVGEQSAAGLVEWPSLKPRALLSKEDVVDALAFSPDGRSLATGTSLGASSREAVKLWDVASGKLKAAFPSPGRYAAPLAFSPDGTMFAVGGYEEYIRLQDAATGKTLAVIDNTQFAAFVAFSPDGKTVAAPMGSKSASVKLWDLAKLLKTPR